MPLRVTLLLRYADSIRRQCVVATLISLPMLALRSAFCYAALATDAALPRYAI